MTMVFSDRAVIKLKQIIGDKSLHLLVRSEDCNRCNSGSIRLSLVEITDLPEVMCTGNSNGINWIYNSDEAPFLFGTEIDFKSDEIGEYFEIFNLGHFIPFPIEHLTLVPDLTI